MKSKVNDHFNKIAGEYDHYKNMNGFYYQNLKKLLKKLVPKTKSVLEFGCGTGDLIAFLNPKKAAGFDPSAEMIKIAKTKHKKVKFDYRLSFFSKQKYDYIFMSDVIEHLEYPEKEFKTIKNLMSKKGKLLVTMANPILEPILMIAENLKLKMPEGPHKRITFKEIELILNKIGMKVTKHNYKLLMPIKILLITKFMNKYLEKYFKKLCFIEYFEVTKI